MMFRFLIMLVATGVAIYKTLYGNNKAKETPPQHTEQPIEVSIPVVVFQTQPIQKSEVLWGESLTDEEWSMVQNADHRYLN